MSKDTLRLTPQILDRLNFFADGPVGYLGNTDEDVKAQSFYGVLYGLRVKNISQHPVILNCSGNAVLEGQDSLETLNVEFLSELLPIGLDPVGVLYLSSNVDDVEKNKVLAKLIDNLPDQEAFVHDPIVITKNGDGPLITSTFSEGEFKELQHEVIDANEINQHITTIRLRGSWKCLLAPMNVILSHGSGMRLKKFLVLMELSEWTDRTFFSYTPLPP